MTFPHAWIGWNNYVTTFGATASSEATGFPALNLSNWYSWQRWRGGNTGPWTLLVDCGEAKPANYFALCGHTGLDHLIQLHGSNDNATWTQVLRLLPGSSESASYDGQPVYDGAYNYDGEAVVGSVVAISENNLSARFDSETFRYWRVTFSGGSKVPEVGVVAIGPALDFQRGFYGSFVRPAWNEDVEVTNSISERGVFLGRSTLRAGNKPFSVKQEPVTHAWVQDNWMPFRAHADLLPFVFVWEPDPNDLSGTINNTDTLLAWRVSWEQSTLRDKRWASVGGQFEGTLR